ncbi:MAG TPA: hypothetical protein VII06_04620 [Chloroflexota bacterium]
MSGLWMGIRVAVEDQGVLLMVLDTGSPVSALSPTIAQRLYSRGLLRPASAPSYYSLSGLSAEDAVGQPGLPDLTVRALPRLGRLQIEGLLGLDFFRQFDRVCFQLSAMQLELTY